MEISNLPDKELKVMVKTMLTKLRRRMDLMDTYRIFHPKAAEHTFFSSIHGTFSRINHTSLQNRSQ